MFQVAAHPSAFNLHSHGQYMAHQQQQHLPHPPVQLPRTLSRPKFTDPTPDAIRAASPDCADVPAEYIRRGLRQNPAPMLAGTNAVSIPPCLPRSHITPTFNAPLRASSTEPAYPTHILAISSAKSSSAEQVHLFPVHAITLAVNCARVPALPPSNPSPSPNSITLPVLPLTLPSPAAFHVVHQYLYTHRLDAVMSALGFPASALPTQNLTHQSVLTALQSPDTLHQLAMLLCQHTGGNLGKLTGLTARVKDLWQDLVSLGLYENELWDTIDLAWEILLGALNLAAAHQQ